MSISYTEQNPILDLYKVFYVVSYIRVGICTFNSILILIGY